MDIIVLLVVSKIAFGGPAEALYYCANITESKNKTRLTT
jgi:hypothetical protein